MSLILKLHFVVIVLCFGLSSVLAGFNQSFTVTFLEDHIEVKSPKVPVQFTSLILENKTNEKFLGVLTFNKKEKKQFALFANQTQAYEFKLNSKQIKTGYVFRSLAPSFQDIPLEFGRDYELPPRQK